MIILIIQFICNPRYTCQMRRTFHPAFSQIEITLSWHPDGNDGFFLKKRDNTVFIKGKIRNFADNSSADRRMIKTLHWHDGFTTY